MVDSSENKQSASIELTSGGTVNPPVLQCFSDAPIEWLDSIINRLQGLYNTNTMINNVISFEEVISLIYFSIKPIMADGTLIEIDGPVKIFGDIHGQYQNFHQLLDITGRVPTIKALFLGDYVDRGPQSLEVICYLLALKCRYPDKCYLIRGNHETPSVNRIYGFYNECGLKYNIGMWWDFQSLFNRLPMAALVSKRIFCMHGGLSPELTNFDTIRSTIRPVEPPESGYLTDLIWSDPTNKGDGWFYSTRGISCAFGRGVVEAASKIMGFDLIVRAHQVVQEGYEIMVGKSLITVFSAPNYCGQFCNAGAVVCISEKMQVSLQQLKLTSPANCKKTAPVCAADVSEATANEGLPTWNLNDPQKTFTYIPNTPKNNAGDSNNNK
ncbi:Serine/threonine-protein phosphatase PP1-beta catalytic subunit [Strongyloides ratti]|uniref:Serine/threonine-protein phosphatase n=1 Tax=Strongyloides ratti TaxID=34506 RepID=A0A090L094_STRRB|nr:Serine/threonine-protein phosphatase PP1-beta catalytic subunit [Strongyloides ratti]CEF63106.1 Serine/threonine-protein phosphatase PP1-beta catalytic subunit [Strongyloides ratti]